MLNLNLNWISETIKNLAQWWPVIKSNFQQIQDNINNHFRGITDKHKAEDVGYSGKVEGATNSKEGLDLLNDQVEALDQKVDTIILNPIEGEVAAQEVVLARGTADTLPKRLDGIDSQLADITKKTSHIVNVSDFGVTNTSTVIDQTVGIQAAIDYVSSLGGGTVQFNNAIYYAQGVIPKNNVTLRGTGGSVLKLATNATTHLIYYNDAAVLINFNLYNMILDGNAQTVFDVIHIDEPTPDTTNYTWDASVVDNCIIQNGGMGIYCPIPGSVKIVNTYIAFNDIGVKQLQEHFYITNTTFWHNRVGADIYKANHFTWVNAIFAHSTDAGIISLDTGGAAFQNALIGCSFIDNPYCLKGKLQRWRIIGCRFIDSEHGIYGVNLMNIIDGCEFQNLGTAIEFDSDSPPMNNSITACAFSLNNVDIVEIGDNNNIINNQFMSTETVSIKTGGGLSQMALNIQNNHFYNGSTTGDNLYPFVQITTPLNSSIISDNIFRNSATGKVSHAVWFDSDALKVVTDTLLIGNVARNMKTAGYQIKTAVTQANNIGTVVTV